MSQEVASSFENTLIKNNSGQVLLFFVVFAVFIITIAASLGLYLLNNAQENAMKNLQDQVSQKENVLSGDSSQILSLNAKFKTLRQVLDQHIHDSNIFAFIESNTHPQVTFSNFQLAEGTGKVDLQGVAPSYTVLTQQVLLFERDSNIKSVEFGGLSLGSDGLLSFKLSLIFKPEIFTSRSYNSNSSSTTTSP